MTQDPGSGQPMSERMQSLLNRAVEDQLSEQRQLAGALTEVRAQLGRLGSQLEAMQVNPGGGQQLQQLVSSVTADMRDSVRVLAERLDGVARLVGERGHDLAELRSAVDELRGSVDGQSHAIAGLTGGLGAVPALGQRIDALQSTLAGLGERLSGIEQLSAAVSGMQQRSEALEAALRDVRQAVAAVDARAASLPGRDDMQGLVSRVGDNVTALGTRMARLETSLPSLLERLDGLDDKIGDEVERLHVTLAERAAGPDDGSEGMASAGAVLAAVESLSDRVDALSRDVRAADDDSAAVSALGHRLTALEERLFGADGLDEAVSQLVARDPADETERVAAVVAEAVAASERRLTDHLDEAILALAEAVLRRKPGRAGGTARAPMGPAATAAGAPAGTAEPARPVVSAVEPDGDGGDTTDDPADDEADDPADVEAADTADDAVEPAPLGSADDAADDAYEDGPAAPPTPPPVARPAAPAPWQTPRPATAAPAPAEQPEEPEPGKRRRWWQPGG